MYFFPSTWADNFGSTSPRVEKIVSGPTQSVADSVRTHKVRRTGRRWREFGCRHAPASWLRRGPPPPPLPPWALLPWSRAPAPCMQLLAPSRTRKRGGKVWHGGAAWRARARNRGDVRRRHAQCGAHMQLDRVEHATVQLRGQCDALKQRGGLGESPPLGRVVCAAPALPELDLLAPCHGARASIEQHTVSATHARRFWAASVIATRRKVLPTVHGARWQRAKAVDSQSHSLRTRGEQTLVSASNRRVSDGRALRARSSVPSPHLPPQQPTRPVDACAHDIKKVWGGFRVYIAFEAVLTAPSRPFQPMRPARRAGSGPGAHF